MGAFVMDITTIGAFLPGIASLGSVKTAKQFAQQTLNVTYGSSAAIGIYSILNSKNPLLLGVSQAKNGIVHLPMRLPANSPSHHSNAGMAWMKYLRSLF
jgi:hypothetical protein